MRKKERFVLGKRTFRSQKSKHFVLRIINGGTKHRNTSKLQNENNIPYHEYPYVNDSYSIGLHAIVVPRHAQYSSK